MGKNKVCQFLLRGNTHSNISILHIIQPTIPQDIDYIKSKYLANSNIQPNDYQKNTWYFMRYRWMIKNSWKIKDNDRTNITSTLKVMSVIIEWYRYKMEILGTENALNQMKNLYKELLVKERE